MNDRQPENGAADFLLAAPDTRTPNSPLPAVTAPTSHGTVLFRTLIDRENDLAEIDVGRRNADCSPYKAG